MSSPSQQQWYEQTTDRKITGQELVTDESTNANTAGLALRTQHDTRDPAEQQAHAREEDNDSSVGQVPTFTLANRPRGSPGGG